MEKYRHTLRAVRISDFQETMQEPRNLFFRVNCMWYLKKIFPQLVYNSQHCNLLSAGYITKFLWEWTILYRIIFLYYLSNASAFMFSDLLSFHFVCPNVACKFILQGLPFILCFCSKSIEFWLDYWGLTMRNYYLYCTYNGSVTCSSSLWKLACVLVRRVVTLSFLILPFLYQSAFLPHINKICKSTIQGMLNQNIFEVGVLAAMKQWIEGVWLSTKKAELWDALPMLPSLGLLWYCHPKNSWDQQSDP